MTNYKLTKKISVIICLTCLLMFGCSRHCPDFDDDILRWIPYKTNDTISLLKNNQTVKFIVTKTFLEHTTNYKGKCGCSNDFGFESDDQSGFINFSSSSDTDIEQFYLNITYGEFQGTNFPDKTQLNEILIDSIAFQNVLVFTGDSSSASDKIWKVIFAKDKGVVAIFYKDSIMIDKINTNKETSQTYYNVNNTKCD